MRTKTMIVLVLSFLIFSSAYGQKTSKQKVVQGNVCGNPNVKCNTDGDYFAPFEIQFELPKNYIVYESKPFYAIILKSHIVKDIYDESKNCKEAATEEERLATQKLFPDNKVFVLRCGFGTIYYSGVKENTVFMAVYGGKTLAQAQKFLSVVQNSGKFEGAYIKKLQSQFNGT